MAKKKLLVALAAGVVVVWGATQIGWDDVWGAKNDKAALAPAPSSAVKDGAKTVDTPAAGVKDAGSAGGKSAGDAKSGNSGGSGAAKPGKTSDKPSDNDGGTAVSALDNLLATNAPAQTIEKNDDGRNVVTNATSLLVLVNKKREMPSDYVPEDLVVPNVKFSFSGENEKKYMRKEAANALEELFAGAKDDDIELAAVSGYRSYKRQKAIFDSNAAKKGAEVANQTSAVPGQSEHQTGLAMDVSSASAKYELETTFGTTKEGKWLAAHAHEYGFIIRYPKGKQDITGYTYEPWHVRYVGKDVAAAVYKSGLTLEQFMAQYDDAAKA